MQGGQNMNLFIGCGVFYGLDGRSTAKFIFTLRLIKNIMYEVTHMYSLNIEPAGLNCLYLLSIHVCLTSYMVFVINPNRAMENG